MLKYTKNISIFLSCKLVITNDVKHISCKLVITNDIKHILLRKLFYPGFSVTSAARVLVKLMERLGHKEFYLQGGDWGGIISTHISIMFPR